MSTESVAENIPPGYKQTEVGVIPEDWDVKKLGKTAILKARIGWQGLTTNEYLDSGDYCLVTGTEFKNGYIDWDNCHYVTDSRYQQDKNIQLKEQDILVTKDGTIGKVALINQLYKPATLNSGVFVIRPINSAFHPEFFYYLLCSNIFTEFLSQLSAGSTINHLYQKDFISFLYTTPSTLAEQEAIATTLSDTDALIESLEQLIAKKRQIKQGAMQELLTGKRRLPGFSGGWEVKCVGDVLKIAHGRSQHAVEDQNGIYPILATGGQIGTANQFLYDKPSVLIGRKGTIDKPQFMDKPFWTVDTLFYSIILEPNNVKFLYYKFCLIDWKQYNEASGVPSLNARTIERIELKIPSSEEQTAIATILSDMDSEITLLEEKLAKTRQIKQGMMQELLTGRTRLV